MNELTKKMTASGQVYNGPCWFTSCLIGTDAANDPQVTLTDSSGAPAGTEQEKLPTCPYDASVYGLNGVEKCHPSYCEYGLYLTLEAVGGGAFGGTAEIVVGYVPA